MRRRDGRETVHPSDPIEDLYGTLWECAAGCVDEAGEPLRFYSVDRLVSSGPETVRWLRD